MSKTTIGSMGMPENTAKHFGGPQYVVVGGVETRIMYDDDPVLTALPSMRPYDIWIWNRQIGPTPYGIPRSA